MRYMVVFKFGSVVFYNVGAQEREECLELTRNFVESPLAYPMKEDYLVKGITAVRRVGKIRIRSHCSKTIRREQH